MEFKHITPTTLDGTRLFYRSDWNICRGLIGGHYTGQVFIPPKNNSDKGLFRPAEPSNVIAQIRLYRYFYDEYNQSKKTNSINFSGLVDKDELMTKLFDEVTKHRVGRLLRMCVPYRVNFQRPALRSNNWTNQQFWRWAHPLDIAYGLEHLMTLWLPRLTIANDGKCSTDAEYNEELEILRQQTPAEDLDLIQSVIERQIY